MDVYDIFLLPAYLLLFYFLAQRTVSANYRNPLYQKYYKRGLWFKITGTVFFVLIYLYYYGGGDSPAYFYASSPLYNLFFSNPLRYFEYMTSSSPVYPAEYLWRVYSHNAGYMVTGSVPTITTIKITTLINFLCFNSYIVCSLMFAYISYRFIWEVFLLFVSIRPKLERSFAFAFLYVPSTVFWASAVSKDTINLCCIMVVTLSFYNLVILRKNIVRNIIILAVSGYILTLVRSFILFSLAPGLLLMAFNFFRNRIASSVVRFLALPVIIIGGVAFSYLFVQGIGSEVQSYSVDNMITKAEGFQSWHTYLGETKGGSFYSLGDISYTPVGILSAAPLALVLTLFGPFLWQVRNPVMLISGVESAIFLYFTLRVVFYPRVYRIFNILLRDHLLSLTIPFTIVVGIAIGITSFNYGALVRYKVSLLPFFASSIAIIYYHLTGKSIV